MAGSREKTLVFTAVFISLIFSASMVYAYSLYVFSDGSLSKEIIFMNGGGVNSSAKISVPLNSNITSAEVNVTGMMSGSGILHDVIVVTDVSGSMSDKLGEAKNAVISFINRFFDDAGTGSKTGLVNYSYSVRGFVPLTNDKNALEDNVNSYGAFGGTCISCGINKSKELVAAGTNPKRVIVVMTDGTPSRCISGACSEAEAKQETLDNAEDAWETYGAMVYAVAYEENADMETMQQVAALGNGKFYYADRNNITDVYLAIESEMLNMFPSDISIDIGGNPPAEWNHQGELNTSEIFSGFDSQINEILGACSCSGCSVDGDNCTIDLVVSSGTAGKIVLNNLAVEYDFLPEDMCNDSKDNDHDGFTDCDDSDCTMDPACDYDGDGVPNQDDNCLYDPNPDQNDTDSDGMGDVCDACALDPMNDIDSDGVCGNEDNCPDDYNPGQEDADNDTAGDVCDAEDNRPDLYVHSIEFDSAGFLECDTVNINITVRNRGLLNATEYNFTLQINNSTFSEQHINESLPVNGSKTFNFSLGPSYTCGNLSIPVRAETADVLPLGDSNETNNINETAINLTGIRKADVDDDSENETALDENRDESDGYEVYQDPNNSTNTTRLDGDGDGKTDYLVDIGKTGMFDRYWDPDNGIISSIIFADNKYFISADNGTNIKIYYSNGSLEDAALNESDIDSDGSNETIVDANMNSQADGGDLVWNDGFFTFPDLFVSSITFSPSGPVSGQSVTITAIIENLGNYSAENVSVVFEFDSAAEETKTVSVPGGESAEVRFSRTVNEGNYNITVSVDRENNITEQNESNNYIQKNMNVGASGGGNQNTNTNSQNTQTQTMGISVSGVPDNVTVMQGNIRILAIYIENTGTMDLDDLTPQFTGDGADIITINPTSFAIPSGKVRSGTLFIDISKEKAAGEYEAVFELKESSILLYSKSIKIIVTENASLSASLNETNTTQNQTIETSAGNDSEITFTGMLFIPSELVYMVYAAIAAAVIFIFYKIRPSIPRKESTKPWEATLRKVKERG